MKQRIVLGALTALAAASLSLAAASPAAAAEVAATKPCGYSESEGNAWYNHCTSDGSWIWIKIDVVFAPDSTTCVGPGLFIIGPSANYRNAYYTGDLCAHGLSPMNHEEG
ncbi:DUF6355 family natural product biosynthesis protein [Amycolatopsis sp. MEPSY49]|uniref:DUF6355 family natural product biosynthesis protein n=1 Tax=Amycolatopsis sp. MEPSY49 TaxID=3151600 RepID=UPI003EF6FFA9